MDGSRHNLFAGAGLAQQQHGPAAAPEFLDHPHYVADARRLAH
jgi:hypothetical protein